MSFLRITPCVVAVVAALSEMAVAEEAVTVQSLVKDGYAIVGTVAVPTGGGGLLLQKKDQVFFCFTTETPNSPAVTTRYCKPVQ
jgi:hypothetical protein